MTHTRRLHAFQETIDRRHGSLICRVMGRALVPPPRTTRTGRGRPSSGVHRDTPVVGRSASGVDSVAETALRIPEILCKFLAHVRRIRSYRELAWLRNRVWYKAVLNFQREIQRACAPGSVPVIGDEFQVRTVTGRFVRRRFPNNRKKWPRSSVRRADHSREWSVTFDC